MMANAALLAALTMFLLVGELASELSFLAPFKAGLFRLHSTFILGAVLLVFFNLSALYYGIARWLWLGDSGRKLRHVDHQLSTPDAVLDELGRDLTA
jgi:hypothetical protein